MRGAGSTCLRVRSGCAAGGLGADLSTEGLADQQRKCKIREGDWRREAQERARERTPDTMWKTASHSLLKGLSYALLDVFGATITDIHLRASTVPIHRRKA